MIHPFFLLPHLSPPLILYPSPELLPYSMTGSLQRLLADSVLCPPSGSLIIVLGVDVGHWQRGTCREGKKKKGGACVRMMGDCPTVSQRTAAGQLFIPFVRSQAVFSFVKAKFNLHPFTQVFSPPPHYPILRRKKCSLPPPYTHTLTCSSLFLIRLPCLPFFLFLSTPSVTPAMHTHKKRLYSVL